MNQQEWAYTVGLLVGVIVMLSVVYVFIKERTLNTGGVVLSLIGMILIGLSIWSNIKIQTEGLTLELKKIKGEVSQLASASKVVTEEVTKITRDIDASNQQVLNLTRVLSEEQPSLRQHVEQIERDIPPHVFEERIQRLDSVKRILSPLNRSRSLIEK